MVNKVLLLSTMLVVAALTTCLVNAQQPNFEIQNTLNSAYKSIVDASNAGTDTTSLIAQLNQAINKTAQAQLLGVSDPQQAQTIINDVQTVAQNITQQAIALKESASVTAPFITIVIIISILAAGVSIYVFGPRVFYRIWFRLRRNYRVNIQNIKHPNNSVVTPQQIFAVILGIIIVVASVLAVSVVLPTQPGERFSELGILGPNMKLGDYQSTVVASETVNLYVYVGNQMGKPMFYTVMVKLGNNATAVNPANLVPLQQYQQVLDRNQTWTFPISVTLNEAGTNQRLIFELWVYNETTSEVQYHERCAQIWMNVTAPST